MYRIDSLSSKAVGDAMTSALITLKASYC